MTCQICIGKLDILWHFAKWWLMQMRCGNLSAVLASDVMAFGDVVG